MKKRLLSLILTFAVIVSMFTAFSPEAQATTTFGPYVTGNIQWSVEIPTGQQDGTLIIGSRTGVANAAIPNYSSASLASRPPWFGHNANVNRIILEPGITEIGNWAFADFTKVTEIIVMGNISRIGNDAFRECVPGEYPCCRFEHKSISDLSRNYCTDHRRPRFLQLREA